jgi:hypothetical protein
VRELAMSLSVHLGTFNSRASLGARDVLARLGRIVDLDRPVERSPNPFYVSPDTLPVGTGVTCAAPTA